jgi:hypothetical protein
MYVYDIHTYIHTSTTCSMRQAAERQKLAAQMMEEEDAVAAAGK